MYCAVVQGELIARQIDSGLSSAMGVKASAVWPQLAVWSLTQYKGATRFCTVLISRAWPSQFSPPCFDNSSALSAALGNLWIASAFHTTPLQCSSPPRNFATFLCTVLSFHLFFLYVFLHPVCTKGQLQGFNWEMSEHQFYCLGLAVD